MTTYSRTTPELRKGDVVLCHGMRVLLDSEPVHDDEHHRPNVHRCDGLVLNRAELSTDVVPIGYTHRGAGQPHRWTVQGNDLATWEVEA